MWSGRAFQVAGPACENARSMKFVISLSLTYAHRETYRTTVVGTRHLQQSKTSCYCNGSDSSHRHRHTGRFVVFDKRCHCAPSSNTWFLGPKPPKRLACSLAVCFWMARPFTHPKSYAKNCFPMGRFVGDLNPHLMHGFLGSHESACPDRLTLC